MRSQLRSRTCCLRKRRWSASALRVTKLCTRACSLRSAASRILITSRFLTCRGLSRSSSCLCLLLSSHPLLSAFSSPRLPSCDHHLLSSCSSFLQRRLLSRLSVAPLSRSLSLSRQLPRSPFSTSSLASSLRCSPCCVTCLYVCSPKAISSRSCCCFDVSPFLFSPSHLPSSGRGAGAKRRRAKATLAAAVSRSKHKTKDKKPVVKRETAGQVLMKASKTLPIDRALHEREAFLRQ